MPHKAFKLSDKTIGPINKAVTFGVCATCDPRVDLESRERTKNIIGMVANALSQRVKMPTGKPANVVFSTVLIDGEQQADTVARQFKEAGVDAIICTPDTWAFPQLTLMSLMAHFPANTPLNITCGNSAPKPGVVFCPCCKWCFCPGRQANPPQCWHMG